MRVFVTQNGKKRNSEGRLVEKFDFGPAKEHGEVKFLLHEQTQTYIPKLFMEELRVAMEEFQPGDCLIPVGSPLLIGAVMILAHEKTGGNFHVLQWSGRYQKYSKFSLDI